MKLSELEPRWIHASVFVFRCPHCREKWLTCQTRPIVRKIQFAAYKEAFGEDWNTLVVPCRPEASWSISASGAIDTTAVLPTDLTVNPSIDASASGHWHGWITSGEIR